MQARFTLGSTQPSPASETCWFCGAPIDLDDDGETVALTLEPLGPGEATYGYCHATCAERARGSLAP